MYIPINSVVKYKGDLAVYRGVLHNNRTLQVFEGGKARFVDISEIEYEGLEIIRFPSELAAAYVRGECDDE